MKIDLTCPAEWWRTALPREDSPVCELTMYNLSDKVIVSMEVTLTLMDASQEELCRVIYRAHDLHGQAEKPFLMAVPVEEDVKPASAEVVVEKIWFDDNSVWRRGKTPLSEYTSNALPNSRSLEELRYIAGKDAVGYPEEQSGLWLCVCGRPNMNGSRICIRCHRNRTEVFADLTREAVQKQTELRERQLALKGKQARESASRHQAQREKEYEAKQRKRRRNTLIASAVALCLAGAYGTVFHLLPYLNYRSALGLMDAGQYDDAIAAFANMGDYGDAAANITRCTYLQAAAQLDTADADALVSLRETLSNLGDYEDAPALVLQADYRRAGLLLEGGSISEARALYVSLGDYEDAPAQILRCDYLTAQDLLSSGAYGDAHDCFIALGDYEDAADLAKECIYLPACDALTNGDVYSAEAQFALIPGYKDADALLAQAIYQQAVTLRQSGDLVQAGERFLQAGDVEDAPQQANECLYQAADAAALSGDHVTAADLFAQVLTYLDAQDRWNQETYQLATAALKDLEYIRARTLLSSLPEDYEDVAELRLEALYRPSVTAYKKAEYQTALDGFLQLGDYKDSAEQALKSRYQLAESLRVDGQYAEALAHYELLGDYEDVPTQMKLTRYQLGVQAIRSGQYAEAMTIFTELGDYKDSDDKLKEATYGNACALMDAGDYDTARAQFASLGKYSDARDKIPACDYARAGVLAQSAQTAEAAALYLSLGDYEDAQAQGQALYYALATTAESEGRTKDAAALYALIPGYQDADARIEAIYDAEYAAVQQAVQQGMEAQDYPLVIAILQQVDMTDLPAKYASLPETYQEACYQQASRLYAAGDVYGALPYYQLIPGYRNVDELLSRSCYLILGQWLGENGESYLFLPDGTCSLNGEKLYYAVSTYAMQTGTAPDALSLTHKVSSIDAKRLSLRDIRDGQNTVIHLTRDDSYALTIPAPDLPEAPVLKSEPVATVATAEPDAASTETQLPLPEVTSDPLDSFEVVDE